MPWKETQKMDQKVMFVQQALNPQANFRQLCREYGISAKTGYKWMERFEMGGLSGLAEANRRPSRRLTASAFVSYSFNSPSRHRASTSLHDSAEY